MKLIGIDTGTTTISGIVMEHNIGNNAELIEAKTIANDSFLPTANDWEKIPRCRADYKKGKGFIGLFSRPVSGSEEDRAYGSDAWDLVCG